MKLDQGRARSASVKLLLLQDVSIADLNTNKVVSKLVVS